MIASRSLKKNLPVILGRAKTSSHFYPKLKVLSSQNDMYLLIWILLHASFFFFSFYLPVLPTILYVFPFIECLKFFGFLALCVFKDHPVSYRKCSLAFLVFISILYCICMFALLRGDLFQ